MRVLLFVFLFLSLSSIIDRFVDAQSSCPDGSSPFNCVISPCENHQCIKGRDFCVEDYCGGCNAKCQCDNNSHCQNGEECQAGFCVSIATTPAPETSSPASTNCPSDVKTAECICLRKGKYWAVGGFHDGCTDCECKPDGNAICLAKICPIIPTDAPTDVPTSSVKPATINATTINTCIITREEDFSTCQGGITPCSVVRCGTGPCIAHRCGTNGQCAATCSCESDSNCFNGDRCIANEFGIKVCKAPSTTNSTPINTCVLRNDFSSCENQMNPCAVTLCKAGTVCIPHKCENNQCSAVCACAKDSDCGSGLVCAANKHGIKVCQEPPTATPSSSPAPTTSECPRKVCPAILCANRAEPCKYRCGINYCSCSDYCACRNNTDCSKGEVCEGASKGSEGKCVAPPTCSYNGRTYQSGASFPSSDGCNTCFCGENGSVGCTKKACICPPEIGFATCKQAPCDANPYACATRRGATCINDYCGGCNTKCQCESNDQCRSNEICRADGSGFNYCVKRNTPPPTTTTTRRPTTRITRTTTVKPTTTRKTTTTTTTRAPSTTNSTPINTCVLRNDFSSCENQMNPCAVTLCLAGTVCIPHKCENNQCSAVCACAKDSDCGTGLICAANDFGIKVCTEDPSQTCPDGRPEVKCTVAPCSVASNRCKKGRDFCVDDYCGGCNAKCQCDSNRDCYYGEKCQADWKGNKSCTKGSVTPAPSTSAPSTTPCNPEGRVCPAILCTTRQCNHRCSINYCGCTDYCSCRNNSDCSNGEVCEGATFRKEGKCTLPSI